MQISESFFKISITITQLASVTTDRLFICSWQEPAFIMSLHPAVLESFKTWLCCNLWSSRFWWLLQFVIWITSRLCVEFLLMLILMSVILFDTHNKVENCTLKDFWLKKELLFFDIVQCSAINLSRYFLRFSVILAVYSAIRCISTQILVSMIRRWPLYY